MIDKHVVKLLHVLAFFSHLQEVFKKEKYISDYLYHRCEVTAYYKYKMVKPVMIYILFYAFLNFLTIFIFVF